MQVGQGQRQAVWDNWVAAPSALSLAAGITRSNMWFS